MEKKDLFDFIDSDRVEITLLGNDGFDDQEIKCGKEYFKYLINEMIDTMSMSKSMLCECDSPEKSIINENLCKKCMREIRRV